MKSVSVALALCLLGSACGKKETPSHENAGATATPEKASVPASENDATPAFGESGRHVDNPEWIPAEHKQGRGKWKDAGVYVDGKLTGVLWFGELPLGLEPVWKEEKVLGEFRRGEKPPLEVVRTRLYNLADYLRAIGVDLRKVKKVHVYGGKQFVAEASGRHLRRHPDDIQFRFGRGTAGKVLAEFNSEREVKTSFDHITAVAVYVEKEAPRIEREEAFLHGERVEGIPYYGEPMRGGVRVYLNDRVATVIKRRRLAETEEAQTEGDGGEPRWKLLEFLAAQGVETGALVEADLIYDERRVERLSKESLADAYFVANPQAGGSMLLNGERPVEALALYTKKAPPIPSVEEDPLNPDTAN